MSRASLLCFALMALAVSRTATAGFESGGSLLEHCTKSDKLIEQACLGYIAAVADALEGGRFVAKAPQCLPVDIQLSQLRDVVVKYLQNHPTTRNRDAVFLVSAAIVNKWCPVE